VNEKMSDAEEMTFLMSLQREMVEMKRKNEEMRRKSEEEMVEGGLSIGPRNPSGKSFIHPTSSRTL